MKVTAIKTLVCHAYRCNWVFVKVLTDEGVYGVGEATLEMRERTVAQAVQELERLLVGQDPRKIEAFWHQAYRDVYWRGGPVLMTALAGVEMALWDIKGKWLGVPVYELLGGPVRNQVPCYANGWFTGAKTAEEFAVKARQAAAAGFQALKWDPFGSAYMNLTRKEFHQAIERVEAVVDALKGQADIIIEGHGRLNVPTAIRFGRALERLEPLWFEEPVPPDNWDALSEVKRRIRIPVAAGERLYSRWDYRSFLAKGCADIVQPDVCHVGGILEAKTIAAMAECHYMAFCPHNPNGPVANAATLQLAACTPNFHLLETMPTDVPYRTQVAAEYVEFQNGFMSIPTGPGLGIDLNEEAIQAHPYEPKDLRHYRGDLTEIRPPDAKPFWKHPS